MAGFFPQAVTVIETRDTAAIPAKMSRVSVASFMVWAVRGVRLGAYPLVAAHGLCLMLSGFIQAMKLFPRRRNRRMAN